MSREEGAPDKYLSNSSSSVPSERGRSARPSISSSLLSNPRPIVKLEKTDGFLTVDNLRGVAGAAPLKGTEGVRLEACLPRYSDIFDDDSGFEFKINGHLLTSFKSVVRASLM